MDDSNRESIFNTFIYTYAYIEDERSLCLLEQRSFFGKDSQTAILESSVQIDPSRSPFITGRLAVIYEGSSMQDLVKKVSKFKLMGATFKVSMNKSSIGPDGEKVTFDRRREIEREIGLSIHGQAELVNPEQVYGVMVLGERWLFGEQVNAEAIWLRHMKKPQAYSTALSTRLARAVVNIAVPHPEGIRVIDPCCGIGTVLIEALSMGIDIVGGDINPLVTTGARENIAHFGMDGVVTLGAIQNITHRYDVAIIDMPYNLCSVITSEEQLTMLQSAARIANRIVIITIEPIDPIIESAGLMIIDRCIARKSNFLRQVIVCKQRGD